MIASPSRLIVRLASLFVLVAVGCGEPTAQIVRPAESRFTYELPVEFTDLGEKDGTPGLAYGLPDVVAGQLASDPVFLVTTRDSGDLASFQSLRLLTTGGEFDPRPESLDPLPNEMELLGYIEIGNADVWGIRLRLLTGNGVADFQILVDRESDQIVMTQLICTQACFLYQLDLIDQIQASWSLES